MKRLVVFGMLVALVGASLGYAADEGSDWLTDFEEAKKLSEESGKPILADFSGSDWCGWCIRLDREVFSKEEFKKYAAENLILLLVDFPSKKKQSAGLKKQNSALGARYKVRGYPTLLVLNSKGDDIARTGYRKGGAAKYVEHLKGLLAKR